jgi:hypothetical protein
MPAVQDCNCRETFLEEKGGETVLERRGLPSQRKDVRDKHCYAMPTGGLRIFPLV